MKKEHFFDLLEHVDNKYIEEALFDDLDETRPVEVRAGKTRVTPLKIIAPIAACLAVAIGAGFVVSNSGKLAVTPADSVNGKPASAPGVSADEPITSDKTDGFDIDECKQMLLEHLDAPNNEERIWQANTVDIDNDGSSELFLASGNTEDFPGVYVFAKTDNEVKMIGSFDTEENLCNPQSFLRYNKIQEDFWYYTTFKYSRSENNLVQVGEWSWYKIIADDNGISAEQMLSYGAKISEDGTKSYDVCSIGGHEVTFEEFCKEMRKYNDTGLDPYTLKNSNMTISDLYPALDINSVPRISAEIVKYHPEMALGKAMLCSQKCGDCEVSVIGQYVYVNNDHGEDALSVGNMYIVLSQNGKVISVNNNCPIGEGLGQYETYIKLNELDDILTISEVGEHTMYAQLKFNNNEGKKTNLFKIYDGVSARMEQIS